MAPSDDTPNPPPGDSAPDEDPLAKLVEQYLFAHAENELLSVEEFCAQHPEEIRDELSQLCLDAVRVQRTLRQLGSSEETAGADEERIGEFRLERILGRGSFGVVYLAWQESLGRHVALKVLAVNPEVEARAVARFRREAVAAGKLRHPNIVSVHSVGEADGKLFLVMDFIDGPTLGKALEDTKDESSLVTPEKEKVSSGSSYLGSASQRGYPGRVARIIADLADALQLAHDHEIIHRDVKPQNVLLGEDGQPFLADFGLAKDLNELSLSRSGDQAGSPPYMSPEQAMAKRVPIDHRTDVFSLGVVMYEMLALRRPFVGESLARLFYEISFKEPTKLRKMNPRVPRDLETICHKALQKNPDDRFQRAADMAENLRRFLNHESIIVRPPRWYERAWRSVVRHRVAAGVAALMVISVIVAVIWSERVTRTQELERMLTPIRALTSVTDLSVEPTQSLIKALGRTSEALTVSAELSDADADMVRVQRERLLEFGRLEMSQGKKVIVDAFAPGRLRSYADRLLEFTTGLKRLMTSSLFLPDSQTRSLTRADTWYPKLTIDSMPVGADVTLHKRNPVTDETSDPQILGKTPLVQHPVTPGHYRIIVHSRGFGSTELDCVLDKPLRNYDFAVQRLRPFAESREGMVLIPASEFVVGDDTESPVPPYHRRRERLNSFWIDEAEVTNAQYREFVTATNRSPPRIWPNPYDKKLDPLPVVTVSYFDAQAYCAWRGCRLPTLWEWERAARGTEGAKLPRPESEFELSGYALLGKDQEKPERLRGQSRIDYERVVYLQFIRPVRSDREARGPTLLFHTLGNAREWTSTMVFAKSEEDSLAPQPGSRITKGGSFFEPRQSTNLTHLYQMPAEIADMTVGFRCAKSAIE